MILVDWRSRVCNDLERLKSVGNNQCTRFKLLLRLRDFNGVIPEKQLFGMEVKLLWSRRTVWSALRLERNGKGPVRELLWRSMEVRVLRSEGVYL